MSSGPSADDIRRQVATSRLGTIMGGGRQRLKSARIPKAPSGAPALESPKPSLAAEQAGLATGIAGLGVTAAVAAGLNPVLGAIIGFAGQQFGAGLQRALAADEARAAERVAMRNKRRLGEAALDEQRYARRLDEAQRPQVMPSASGMRGAPALQPGDEVAPGGTDKLKNILVG